MKTYSARPNQIEHRWVVIDASGVVLGRLASIIAHRLRGKHKPEFTPHMDTGDYIIVINAEKVHLSGKKSRDKAYYHHSGYPGGLKKTTAEQILGGKHPERVVEAAVKRMLPGNRLSRKQLKKLRVYAGSDHPHAAQKPEFLDIASRNAKNVPSQRPIRKSNFFPNPSESQKSAKNPNVSGHLPKGEVRTHDDSSATGWLSFVHRIMMELESRDRKILLSALSDYLDFALDLDLDKAERFKSIRLSFRRLPYCFFSILSDSLWDVEVSKNAAIALTVTTNIRKYRSKKDLAGDEVVDDFEQILRRSKIDSFVTTEYWPGEGRDASTIEAILWDSLPFTINSRTPKLPKSRWLSDPNDFSVELHGATSIDSHVLNREELLEGQFGGIRVHFAPNDDTSSVARLDFFHHGKNFESKLIPSKGS